MTYTLSIRRDRERAAKAQAELRAAFKLVDRRWQEEVAPIAACKPGCAACCFIRSEVFPAEAELIAERIAGKPELVARVRENAARLDGLTLHELVRQQIPCALLDPETRRCTVYDIRPLACRAHASAYVAPCEDLAKNGPRGVPGARDIVEADQITYGPPYMRGQIARADAITTHRTLAACLKSGTWEELHVGVARCLDKREGQRKAVAVLRSRVEARP